MDVLNHIITCISFIITVLQAVSILFAKFLQNYVVPALAAAAERLPQLVKVFSELLEKAWESLLPHLQQFAIKLLRIPTAPPPILFLEVSSPESSHTCPLYIISGGNVVVLNASTPLLDGLSFWLPPALETQAVIVSEFRAGDQPAQTDELQFTLVIGLSIFFTVSIITFFKVASSARPSLAPGSLSGDTGTSTIIFNSANATNSGRASLNESALGSDVDSTKTFKEDNHKATANKDVAPSTLAIDPASIPLPEDEDDLSEGAVYVSMPSLVNDSGHPSPAGSPPVVTPFKGCANAAPVYAQDSPCLLLPPLTAINAKDDISHKEIAFVIDPASIPLPEQNHDELAALLLSSQTEAALNSDTSNAPYGPVTKSNKGNGVEISFVWPFGNIDHLSSVAEVKEGDVHTVGLGAHPKAGELDPCLIPLPEGDSGLEVDSDANDSRLTTNVAAFEAQFCALAIHANATFAEHSSDAKGDVSSASEGCNLQSRDATSSFDIFKGCDDTSSSLGASASAPSVYCSYDTCEESAGNVSEELHQEVLIDAALLADTIIPAVTRTSRVFEVVAPVYSTYKKVREYRLIRELLDLRDYYIPSTIPEEHDEEEQEEEFVMVSSTSLMQVDAGNDLSWTHSSDSVSSYGEVVRCWNLGEGFDSECNEEIPTEAVPQGDHSDLSTTPVLPGAVSANRVNNDQQEQSLGVPHTQSKRIPTTLSLSKMKRIIKDYFSRATSERSPEASPSSEADGVEESPSPIEETPSGPAVSQSHSGDQHVSSESSSLSSWELYKRFSSSLRDTPSKSSKIRKAAKDLLKATRLSSAPPKPSSSEDRSFHSENSRVQPGSERDYAYLYNEAFLLWYI